VLAESHLDRCPALVPFREVTRALERAGIRFAFTALLWLMPACMGWEGRIDVTAIVESLRNKIERRSGGRPRTPPFDPQLSADVENLRHSTELYHLPLVSARGFLPSAMGLVRRVIRRLLLPWISRQSGYNVTNVRVVDALRDQIELLAYHQALSTEDILDSQSRVLDALCARLNAAIPDSLQEEIAEIKADIGRIKRDLGTLQSQPSPPSTGERSREDIQPRRAVHRKARQDYLPYFDHSQRVVDLRCRRGEFLEVLRAASIDAEGIDDDREMVRYCRDRGLNVTQDDPLSWLDQQPDASLDGVFASRIIEHMSPSQIVRLVQLCQRKLRHGCCLVLESVHPGTLAAFTSSCPEFDQPRPIHPETVRFLLESLSFVGVEVQYPRFVPRSLPIPELTTPTSSAQPPPYITEAVCTLNAFLQGSTEYAVLGSRL
jgi:hypothetical protein